MTDRRKARDHDYWTPMLAVLVALTVVAVLSVGIGVWAVIANSDEHDARLNAGHTADVVACMKRNRQTDALHLLLTRSLDATDGPVFNPDVVAQLQASTDPTAQLLLRLVADSTARSAVSREALIKSKDSLVREDCSKVGTPAQKP